MKALLFEALIKSRSVRDTICTYRRATGVALSILPPPRESGVRLFGHSSHPFCLWCYQTSAGRKACHAFYADVEKCFARQANIKHQLHRFVGLQHVAVPVTLGGRHVATLLGGQVFCREPGEQEIDQIRTQLQVWGVGIDPQRVVDACRKTTVLPEARLRAIGRVFEVCSQFLSNSVNRLLTEGNDREFPVVTRTREYLRIHSTEPLNIQDVARNVHLSTRHLARLWKTSTGATITEHLCRLRVERAKELLRDPNQRISEVAFACGFESIQHFNRVFREHEGMSPRQLRRSYLNI